MVRPNAAATGPARRLASVQTRSLRRRIGATTRWWETTAASSRARPSAASARSTAPSRLATGETRRCGAARYASRSSAARRRMTRAHQDDELVAQQDDPGHPGRRLGEHPECQVRTVLIEQRYRALPVGMAEHHRDPGSPRPQRGHQRWCQDELRIVGDPDHELLARRCRLERAIELDGRAHRVQRGGDRSGQLPGKGGGLHPLGRTLEQVVLECQPQPRQGVARGGLGDAQPCGGAGDVALGVDRLEDAQQVEVEALQRHAGSFTREITATRSVNFPNALAPAMLRSSTWELPDDRRSHRHLWRPRPARVAGRRRAGARPHEVPGVHARPEPSASSPLSAIRRPSPGP